MATTNHEHEDWQIETGQYGLPYCRACGQSVPFRQDDLFPGAWDGPSDPYNMYGCSLCGSAVVSLETHVKWHNDQRTDIQKVERSG